MKALGVQRRVTRALRRTSRARSSNRAGSKAVRSANSAVDVRPSPIHHHARLIRAAVIHASRQVVRDCIGEGHATRDGNRVVATNGPNVGVVVIVRHTVIRFALLVVGGTEIGVLYSAGRSAVDINSAVGSVGGRRGVSIEAPFGMAVAESVGVGGRVLVVDGNTVLEQGAVFETGVECFGMGVTVGRHGLDIQVASDIVCVSKIVIVLGVVASVIG